MGDLRWQKILRHTLYRECLKKISEAEKDRIFCKHDMEHNERVAALLKIYMEKEAATGKNVPELISKAYGDEMTVSEALIDEDILYAAAYLHDIGRMKQYEDGSNHAKQSAILGEEILKDCGYTVPEIEMIINAIIMHDSKSMERAKVQGMEHAKVQGMEHAKVQGMEHAKVQGMEHAEVQGMEQVAGQWGEEIPVCDSQQLLARLLYRADKKSRPCYNCKAAKDCYWPIEKRNKLEDEELIGW